MASIVFRITITTLYTVLCLRLQYAEGKLLGAFVMPHGGIALDPAHFNTTNATAKAEAWEIHDACKLVGNIIAELEPDIILLSTPHGIADSVNFALYLNPVSSGYADTDNCACPPCCYNVTVNMSSDVAVKVVEYFGRERNVSGLSGFGPPGNSSEPFPLRWGEVVPLTFIPGLNMSKSKVVIVSQPSRRYTQDVSMIPELLKLGADLYTFLESLDETVVILISADLAHTHSKTGPYGYSNASEPFDQACGKWASSLDADTLLVTAAQYVDKALSCGYTGLVMLHGALQKAHVSSWLPDLYVNYHPSYYGMLVASFLRRCS